MNNHPIIQELLEAGIIVEMQYNKISSKVEFAIQGFYKSDRVVLTVESDNSLIATARYNQKTTILHIIDIVELNYEWWQSSKDRFSGWSSPSPDWLGLLTKYGFITQAQN